MAPNWGAKSGKTRQTAAGKPGTLNSRFRVLAAEVRTANHPIGRLTRVSSENQVSACCYDAMGQVTGSRQSESGGDAHTFRYA